MYKHERYMYVVTSGDYTAGVKEAIVNGITKGFED